MRLLKLIVVLVILAVAGLAGYAYFGDMAPDRHEMRVPVTLANGTATAGRATVATPAEAAGATADTPIEQPASTASAPALPAPTPAQDQAAETDAAEAASGGADALD